MWLSEARDVGPPNPLKQVPIGWVPHGAGKQDTPLQTSKEAKLSTFDLTRLPRERILHIIEHDIHHEDIGNFALCSRTIFELANSTRAKQLEKKYKYSNFTVGPYPRGGLFNMHPVFSIRSLLQGRDYIEHCTILRLDQVKAGWSPRPWEPETMKQFKDVVQTFEHQLRAMIDSSPYLKDHDSSEWIHLLQMGHMQLAHSLPLTILLNVRILELVDCFQFVQSLDPFTRIVRSYQFQRDLSPRPLYRLQEVRFINKNRHYCSAGMHLLCNFAALPPVKKLHLSGISWETEEERPLWPQSTQSSKVEELCFRGSALEASALKRVLEGIKALKTFSYNTKDDTEHIQPTESRLCLNTVMLQHSESLESMAFVTGSPITSTQYEDATRSISLQGCTALKYVALTCAFFIVHKHAAGPQETECIQEIENWTSFAEHRQCRCVSKIVDMLPATLETLHLFHPQPYVVDEDSAEVAYGNVLEDMFTGFTRQKEVRLPNLRCIVIEGKSRLGERTMEECRQLGITFAFPSLCS
ncbi:MAG: hypothetical protein Q9184_007100 [Pyrenodesmia sp. 2 TL-2023]